MTVFSTATSEPTIFTLSHPRRDEEKSSGKTPMSPNGPDTVEERPSYFSGGEPLQQRISIE